MLISTKGRYALRVLVDIAEHPSDGFIPLKEIADRQEISEKYLESITKELVSQMGGTLEISSEEGSGTTIYIMIPCHASVIKRKKTA